MGSTESSAAMAIAKPSVCPEGVPAERSTDEVSDPMEPDSDCAGAEEGHAEASQVDALSPPL
eukprot:3198824-Amphidinium_carterae.1